MGIALVFVDDGGELAGGSIVYSAAWISVRSQRGGGYADKNLCIRRRSVCDECRPIVVVERCVSVDTQSAGNSVVIIVVKLNKNPVENRVADNDAHVGLRNGALRCAGYVISVARVFGKVGTKFGDHVLIVLAASIIYLNVEIKAVDKVVAKGALDRRVSRVAVRIPKVLADGLGVGLRLQRVRTSRATQGQNNLDASRLAFRNGGGQGFAVLALACRANVARLTNGARRDVAAPAELVQEG